MKNLIMILIVLASTGLLAKEFNPDQFAKDYFEAWSATQTPEATKQDIENYLDLLAEDVGHQHYPYDPDSSRHKDGKSKMFEGMTYYLGAHTAYSSKLISTIVGFDVIIIKYETHSKGVHPQTKQEIESKRTTVEVLELENNKVSVIRKYSE